MKKQLFFSLLVSILFCQFSFAQGWENFQSEDNVVYRGFHVIATSDGNYVSCGFQSGANPGEFGSYIIKTTEDGQELWKTTLPNNTGGVDDIVELPGNRYLMVKDLITSSTLETPLLFRVLDADGNLEESFTYQNGIIDDHNFNILIPQSDGGFVHSFEKNQSLHLIRYDGDFNLVDDIALSFSGAILRKQLDNGDLLFISKTDTEITLYEVDLAGTLLDTKVLSWPVNEPFETWTEGIEYVNNELVFVVVNENPPGSGTSTQATLVRFDQDLNQIDSDIIWDTDYFMFRDLKVLDDGFLICGIAGENANPEGGNGTIIKTDLEGNVEFTYITDNLAMPSEFWEVIPSSESGYLAVGATFNPWNAYLVKITEDALLFSNLLSGKLAVDDIPDCQFNNGEKVLEGWMITAEKDNELFAADISDDQGNYELQLEEGDFVIKVLSINDYWSFCENNINISFTDTDQTATHDFLATSEIDCTQMDVNVNNTWFTPCEERDIHIDYCNYGTVFAPDATLELVVSEKLVVESSTLPWTSSTDNVLVFELGDLGPLDCGSFLVSASLPCDEPIGYGYYMSARVFPNENCNADTDYTGAFLESKGICNPNEVTFLIQNTGTVPTESGKEYFVVEDAVLMNTAPIPELLPNAIFPITIPANGSIFTLIHEQVDLAPALEVPISIVAGCGTNNSGESSQGYFNQFPQGDLDAYIDQDYALGVAAPNPNTLHASPIGYGTPNYIKPNTSIEFIIPFENVSDNLVNNLALSIPLNDNLDISTLKNLTSSHNYKFKFDNGNLIFNYDNILLPSNTVDAKNAQGFLSFRIQPKENTALGTVISNEAMIQFDANTPISTNQTSHTIGEDFIELFTVSTTHPVLPHIKVNVLPNPVEDFAIIEVQNHNADNYTLEIYTTSGKHISTQQYENETIQIRRNQLMTGMYIYKLTSNDGFVNTGRIIFK